MYRRTRYRQRRGGYRRRHHYRRRRVGGDGARTMVRVAHNIGYRRGYRAARGGFAPLAAVARIAPMLWSGLQALKPVSYLAKHYKAPAGPFGSAIAKAANFAIQHLGLGSPYRRRPRRHRRGRGEGRRRRHRRGRGEGYRRRRRMRR